MMETYKISFFFLICCVTDFTFACNGYKAKLVKIEQCADNQIITVDDGFNIELSKDCELIPKGCISSKAFTTAKATYSVSKDGVPVKEGSVDLCDAVNTISAEGRNILKVFALPDHCPVTGGKVCAGADTKADLSKYKNLLGMAKGNIRIDTTIEHDTGKSCFHTELEIYQ